MLAFSPKDIYYRQALSRMEYKIQQVPNIIRFGHTSSLVLVSCCVLSRKGPPVVIEEGLDASLHANNPFLLVILTSKA